jgi:hypothetical protein
LSRYGLISINHSNNWSIQDGLKSTPYMRDLLLYSGQDDNYRASQGHIRKYLRVSTDDSQINRLCLHYGGQLEQQAKSLQEGTIERAQKFSKDLGKDELVYAMFDGCMVPTRPHKVDEEEIGSWKEMKLGRIFRERDHLELGSKPNLIRESIYVNHFGNHQDFTDKLEVVVDRFENLDEQLVFINDGAIWIANFIRANYPNATDILDFYHASEYLHEFSKALFSKKSQKTDKTEWADRQILRLLDDDIESVIEEIEQMVLKGKVIIKAQQKILNYYSRNKNRMLYKTYRDRGLLIGSGPIESAHRFVLQKRMKQSGQKWTKKGGQAVANLRVFHLNEQWEKVVELINNETSKAA